MLLRALLSLLVLGAALLGPALVAPAPSIAQGTASDDDRLLEIPPSNTNETVPRSAYDNPNMTLIEQEAASRNSAASQEVNRNLNTEFANYTGDAPATITFVIFAIASIALLLSEVWHGRAFGYALVDVFTSRLFSWTWSTFWDVVQKLSALAGLVQAVRYFFF